MTLLRSYVGGAWVTPSGDGRPALDAVTGEEIARVSSAGIDMAAALDYGRRTGGPALRALTFHQRAALLKSLGAALREHREELYALSARAGSTLYDARFDVDGGIGVLLSYASKARRELPNDTVYLEGAAEPLGRGGQFLGQHILTPLHGVAVQINAFNFPVWGPLEKFAPAFIAGMPSLVKPASQTAYLTARLVELIAALGYPVWCRGLLPLDVKGRLAVTAWRQPAIVGGLPVRPGDLVVADADGAVVVPARVAAEAVGRALDKVSKENQVRDALAQGSTLRSAYDRFGVL